MCAKFIVCTSSTGDSALVPLPLVVAAADLVATSSFCYESKKNKTKCSPPLFPSVSVKDIVLLICIEKNITRLMPRGTTLGKDATPLIQIQSPSGVLDKVDLDLQYPGATQRDGRGV